MQPAAELALGTGSVWALVDTGAQSPLSVTEEQARSLGIEPDPEGERLLYYNVMGTSTTRNPLLNTRQVVSTWNA